MDHVYRRAQTQGEGYHQIYYYLQFTGIIMLRITHHDLLQDYKPALPLQLSVYYPPQTLTKGYLVHVADSKQCSELQR